MQQICLVSLKESRFKLDIVLSESGKIDISDNGGYGRNYMQSFQTRYGYIIPGAHRDTLCGRPRWHASLSDESEATDAYVGTAHHIRGRYQQLRSMVLRI